MKKAFEATMVIILLAIAISVVLTAWTEGVYEHGFLWGVITLLMTMIVIWWKSRKSLLDSEK